MQHHTINYIEFSASKLNATEAFFKKLFNWSFIYYSNDYMDSSSSGLTLGFYRSDTVSTQSEGAPMPTFYSDNLEASYKEVVNAGGEIKLDIFSFPGGRRFHFLEPSGNEFAIWGK